MMGKTHLASGLSVAIAVAQPDTLSGCVACVMGGAVGGVLADIDMLDEVRRKDARGSQIAAWVTAAVLVLIDRAAHLGLCERVADGGTRPMIGLIAFAVLTLLGIFSSHRRFTHSLTAAVLYSTAVWLIDPSLLLPFAAAYGSHLLLDLINKKEIPLFFPLPFGFCLRLCYAQSPVNRVITMFGWVFTAVFLMCSAVAFLT